MVVNLKRTGGFAGICRCFTVDTALLARDVAADIVKMAVDAVNKHESGSRRPDRFCYELEVDDGECVRRASLGESECSGLAAAVMAVGTCRLAE